MPELLPINPPRISEVIKGARTVRGVVQDMREVIHDGRQGIRDIAMAFKIEEKGETVVTKTKRELPLQETVPAAADGVTDAETLIYQLDHLIAELNLLETHLTEGCRIAKKPCDCCTKAGNRVKNYADESVPIAARQGVDTALFYEMSEWATGLLPIVTKELVVSGKYTEKYRVESGTASKLRKAAEALKSQLESKVNCPGCPKRLSDFQATHKLSLEEAKEITADTAPTAVEESE